MAFVAMMRTALRKQWRRARGAVVAHPLRVACICVPAALFLCLGWIDYRIEIDRARESIEDTTEVLAEQVQAVMATSALVLERVLDHIADRDWSALADSRETHDFLAALQARYPQIESIFLVDPAGHNGPSSRQYPMPAFDVRDREYFASPAAQSTDALLVAAPFRGKATGSLAFTVSRRRVRDGRFDGIVALTVSPAYFERIFGIVVNYPTASAAALVRSDGALLVRFPRLDDPPAMLPADGPLMTALRSGRTFSLFASQNRLSGRAQLSGYRKLNDLPIVVNFSLDHTAYLAIWRVHAAVLACCATLLIGLSLVADGMMRQRALLERQALQKLLTETELRRRAELMAQQSQKMEAIGRLTGGVAHDFNNLLTAILGALELVLRSETNARSLKLLRGAFEAAQRGARLTAQMLSFSRKHEVAIQSVDVGRVVTAMDDLLHRTIGPAVQIRCEVADGLWPVVAEPTQLEMALLNLAVNARDAMPDGGTLTIRACNQAEPGPPDGPLAAHVRIDVIDTGLGMTDDIRARVLEPFFTTKGPGRGTGLGLSMVYGFVSEIGGALAIDSAPGQGTTISLFLRRAEDAPIAPAAEPLPVRASIVGKRILLVDDDARVRLTTRAMLEDLGHRLTDVADGTEALQTLANSADFDLVMLDFAMPGLNGGQLASEIRRRGLRMPLLFMTGYVENDALRPWSDSGYQTLRKPFSADAMSLAVQTALRQQVTRTPASEANAAASA